MCHASEEVAMKKALIIALMIVSVSFLFAEGGDGLYSGVTDFAFRPTSLDRGRDLNYSLFGNAAGLATGGFRVQVPYFESSVSLQIPWLPIFEPEDFPTHPKRSTVPAVVT